MVSRLKTIFLHPFFIGCLVLYFIIRYLRKTDYPLPDWINSYITDLICLPVVLMICLAVVRTIKKNAEVEINKWLILLICLEYSILFEWILPKKSSIYTGDWKDALMYFSGGFIFYLIQPAFRKKIKQAPINSSK